LSDKLFDHLIFGRNAFTPTEGQPGQKSTTKSAGCLLDLQQVPADFAADTCRFCGGLLILTAYHMPTIHFK